MIKYETIINSQASLLKFVQLENKLIKNNNNLEVVSGNIARYTSSKDKDGLIKTFDSTITELNDLISIASAMNKIIPLPSLNGWVSYANEAIDLMRFMKNDVMTVGFTETPTDTDREMVKRSAELAKKRIDLSNKYSKEISDWIFTNRDSVQKDIDRLVIDGNQACNEASKKYQTLYPGN